MFEFTVEGTLVIETGEGADSSVSYKTVSGDELDYVTEGSYDE
jgi:hypothetical protein